jgi:zinc transport system permease protein
MFEIFEFDFIRRAFITGILIAVIAPCIGVIIVLRRLSMIGDTLSHTSLAGIAAGMVAGVNPILGATLFSVFAAFGIEKIRRSFPRYAEIATSVVLSTGVGLAGILSGFIRNNSGFNSFLFGSIVAISKFELYLVVILSTAVIFTMVLLYKELFYITFDEESARLAGVPVTIINFIFTLLTAITVSISSRTVGTLVISSLMVLPAASAIQIAKSYKQTIIYAVLFALISTVSGLFISYFASLKPGGTIVLVGVAILISILAIKKVQRHWSAAATGRHQAI